MKYKLILGTLLLGATLLQAQNVKVLKKSELKLSGAYPVMNDKGDALLISSPGYKGLSYYDLNTDTYFIVTEDSGAGYNPLLEGNQIVFQSNKFENGRKYSAVKLYDLKSKTTSDVVPFSRSQKQLSSVGTSVQILSDAKPLKSVRNLNTTQKTVTTRNGKIMLIDGMIEKELNPIKDARNGYLWASLSDKSDRILFTAAGLNTYIMDLNGKIIADLGKLEAPKWYNDNWVVGMLTKDDGHTITASEILFVSADGKETIKLSDAKEIALYPSVASQSGRIAYATADGKVFVIDLDVNR